MAKCTCEQLNREIYPGELLTVHSKLCPAREGELRGLISNAEQMLGMVSEWLSVNERVTYERMREVLGLRSRIIPSLPEKGE